MIVAATTNPPLGALTEEETSTTLSEITSVSDPQIAPTKVEEDPTNNFNQTFRPSHHQTFVPLSLLFICGLMKIKWRILVMLTANTF